MLAEVIDNPQGEPNASLSVLWAV